MKKSLEKVQIKDTLLQVQMPDKVLHQIKYLCKSIPKEEWSGVLFYNVEGSIKNPKEMKIVLEEILPLDKGTQAHTSYTFGEDFVSFVMDNPHLEDCKIGHIHSHNTMNVFFSGEDWSELEDNTPNHNFYLSLIVNNFMDFCAKVCFLAQTEDVKTYDFKAKDESGLPYTYVSKSFRVNESQMVCYDCDIIVPKEEIVVTAPFKDQVNKIIEQAKNKVSMFTAVPYNSNDSKYNYASFNKKDGVYYRGEDSWFDNSPNDAFGKPLNTPAWSEEIALNDTLISFLTLNEFQDVSLEELYAEYRQDITPMILAKNVVENLEKTYQQVKAEWLVEGSTFGKFLEVLAKVIAHFRDELVGCEKKVEKYFKPTLSLMESYLLNYKKHNDRSTNK